MAACPTNSNRRALDDLRDSEGAATAVIALYLTPCERKVKMLRNLLQWARRCEHRGRMAERQRSLTARSTKCHYD